MLLQAREEHDQAMSDEELRDQLVTLLLAGHETTASGLAWIGAAFGALEMKVILRNVFSLRAAGAQRKARASAPALRHISA